MISILMLCPLGLRGQPHLLATGAVVLPYGVKEETVQSPGPMLSGPVVMQQPHKLLSSPAGLPVTLRVILPFSWKTEVCNSQFSSVAQSSLALWDPMDCSMPGLQVHHQLPEFTQTHVHWVGDAIQPFHPLLTPSPHAFNLSQHQGLFKWVSSLHHVAKLLEFQLQHQSFQWTPRTDLL